MAGWCWQIQVCLLTLTLWGGLEGVDPPGTTPNIQEIFLGRCHDFQETLDPSISPRKICDELWLYFSAAFVGKGHCDVQVGDYDEFAQKATYALPRNKHMFWEGTYEFVHQLSYRGTRYVAVSDILTGFMLDRLVWCGKERIDDDDDGIDYASCPVFGSCDNEVQRSFWRSVSRVFAGEANGEAFVMLNGTTGQAYRNTSVFAEYELAYLEFPRVTKLTAFVVSRYGTQVRETCGCTSCSIRELEKDVQARGLEFACEDNPRDVHYLLCVDAPNAPECPVVSATGDQPSKSPFISMIIVSTLFTLCTW